MNKRDYYEAVAERICFSGITADGLSQVATYKEGKTFSDVANAIKKGRLEGLGDSNAEFGCMAHRLSEVLEIDTNIQFYEFEKRLKALPRPTQN